MIINRSLKRAQSGIATQMRNEHTGLNAYLYEEMSLECNIQNANMIIRPRHQTLVAEYH